jgi:hypothetical protein
VLRNKIMAAAAAAALSLSPAASGLVAELAEFGRMGPVAYCLAKPSACSIAAEAVACASAGASCPAGGLGPQLSVAATARAKQTTPKALGVGEVLGDGWGLAFPRGIGAAYGPLPTGYTTVSRWANADEVSRWLGNGGTAIPTNLGAGGRVYVTDLGSAKPGGTGEFRIDFAVPESILRGAGQVEWRQILQPIQSTPIYNVRIHTPSGSTLPLPKP